MRCGSDPASSSRATRCVNTWVLPEPALAPTQAETRRVGGGDLRLGGALDFAGGMIRQAHSSLPVPFAAPGEVVVVARELLRFSTRPREI